jgi:DHA3 family macrolide efflux protein-like MFS transporter
MKARSKKALIYLFAANTISGFAQGITMLAIPWSIIKLPGGNLLNPLMVSVVTLASLFWGLYAGTLIDRYNRKHVFLTMNGVDCVMLCSVALAGFYLGDMPFILMALAFTTTIFTYNVHFPNLYAFVQELFDPSYYARVNSAIEIQGQSTNFLGMMVGGVLLDGTPDWTWWPEFLQFEAWNLSEIFLMDGITYLLAFLLISQIPYDRQRKIHIDTGTVWERLRLGFQYLAKDRSLFLFGVASHVIFFALMITIQVVGPVYVMDYLKETASTLAFFLGFYTLGAIIAGLMGLSLFVRRNHLIKEIIVLLITAGILYTTLSFTHSVLITWSVAIILGICNAGARILRITYIVRIVPNRVVGRVNSIFAVINVLMRVCFAALLAVPFFSAEGQGSNIVFGTLMLAGVMFIAGTALIARFPKFNHEAAQGE